MEYYQGRICMSFDDLTSGEPPIVNRQTLQKWLQRKNAIYARKAYGEGVTALIEYDTLPKKAKAAIIERYGDPHELLQPKGELAWLPEDFEAKRYFNYEFQYELGGQMVGLEDHLADEYELNARVLNAIIARQGEIQQMTNKLNNRRTNTWKLLHQYSEELRQDYAHTLPKSMSRLQKKVNEYKREGYACLISGKIGNSNTAKITQEAGEYLIALMRNREYVHDFESALLQYNKDAISKGWETIQSVNTIRDYLNDPAIKPLWLGQQVGESVANAKYGAQLIGLEKPRYANALWAADGTKFNIYYLNKEGKRVHTDIYMIFDVCTGYCVGWSLGQESAFGSQYQAYRMAMDVAGVKPFQLVMDNQSSQRKLDRVGFFSKMTEVGVRFKTPYRKQANPAESLIGQFQHSVLRHYPYFTGFNITSKSELSTANLEWLDANLDQLPTYDTLKEFTANCIHQWNSQVVEGEFTREQLYKVERVNPDRMELTTEDYVELFWEKRPRQSTFLQGGLTITEDKKEYYYEAYTPDGEIDIEWRMSNTRRQFGVKYDPLDLTKIAIYRVDKGDVWRFERYLHPAIKVAMAAEDRTAKDDELTKKLLDADKEMRVRRDAIGKAIDIKYKQHEDSHYPRMLGASKADNERSVELAKELAQVDNVQVSVKAGKTSLAIIKKEESKLDWAGYVPVSEEDTISKLIRKM